MVANVRLHGTTNRIVAEAFAAEQPELQALPAGPFDALIRLERRVSHDGLVAIGGNYYSVPDRTRRIVEVHQLANEIRILDGGRPRCPPFRDGGTQAVSHRSSSPAGRRGKGENAWLPAPAWRR